MTPVHPIPSSDALSPRKQRQSGQRYAEPYQPIPLAEPSTDELRATMTLPGGAAFSFSRTITERADGRSVETVVRAPGGLNLTLSRMVSRIAEAPPRPAPRVLDILV